MSEEYFGDAFGGFFPDSDEHSAAKFALNVLAMDDRIKSLVALLTEGDPIGVVGGEPNWELERRDDGDMAIGYAHWPRGAKYRAWVDPDAYPLEWPEWFFARAEFHQLVRAIINVYLVRNPHQAQTVAKVAALL